MPRAFALDGNIPTPLCVPAAPTTHDETVVVSLLDADGRILAEATLMVIVRTDGAYTQVRRSTVVARLTGQGVALSCFRPASGDVYEMPTDREYRVEQGRNFQFTWPASGRVVEWSA